MPTVTIAIGEGFTRSVKAIGTQAGLDLKVATYPGVIATHERETVAKNIEDVLVDQIVRQLTWDDSSAEALAQSPAPADRDIVFAGTFEAVNEHFNAQDWSDGLPIVPPTRVDMDLQLR